LRQRLVSQSLPSSMRARQRQPSHSARATTPPSRPACRGYPERASERPKSGTGSAQPHHAVDRLHARSPPTIAGAPGTSTPGAPTPRQGRSS
jgi:hypothetical protein